MIEGSVRWAGEVIDLPSPRPEVYPGNLVEHLEASGVVERVREEDYTDTMEDRYECQVPGVKCQVRDVMVFTPVLRLEAETVQAVLDLEWPPDGGGSGAITWILQRDNPLECRDPSHIGSDRQNGIYNHLHQFQRGRETFLAGRYDALCVIESDIIPPKDTLKRLAAILERGMDVAYGVYRFRASEVINVYELYPGQPRNPGESLSVHPHLLKRAVKLGVYPCSGAGFGCTMMRREVVERVPFRAEQNVSVHCDTPWITDVLRAGFRSAADFGVVCGHKDSDGTVLWPELGS